MGGQEIGRAGRDGREALCALLLSDQDFVVHHSLAHSKGLELVQVNLLVQSFYVCIFKAILRRIPNEIDWYNSNCIPKARFR